MDLVEIGLECGLGWPAAVDVYQLHVQRSIPATVFMHIHVTCRPGV